MLSLQIKSVINATAFINKNQSGNKPWVVSWKVHSHRQLPGSFLLRVPSLRGFKGFRELSLCSGLVLIGNTKQYKPVNKQALGSGKWESKSALAFIRFYKVELRVYKPRRPSKVWSEQCEIYGAKKRRNTLTARGTRVVLWKTAWYYPLWRSLWFSPLSSSLLACVFWGLAPVFPGLLPTCWASPAGLHPMLMAKQLCRHGVQLHETQRGTVGAHGLKQSQDSSWNANAGESASFLPAGQHPKYLPPSLGFAQCCFTGPFTPSPSAVFVSKGFAWFCFFDVTLISSAALIIPRSVSHPKNSSAPIKLMGLTRHAQGS